MNLQFAFDQSLFDEYIEAADAEFVFGRGRSTSLRRRFPRLFGSARPESVVLGVVKDRLACGAAIQELAVRHSGQEFKIAAVGCVWTRREARGAGYASSLLSEVSLRCRDQGCVAIVLWSTLHSFYARSGYQLIDSGTAFVGEGTIELEEALPPVTQDGLESLRHLTKSKVIRDPMDWFNIPLPVSRVFMLSGRGAHVLGGFAGEVCYVYESYGADDERRALLERCRKQCRTLFVNAGPDEVAFYLSCGLTPKMQSLTMWLPLNGDFGLARETYVPYLDRV